MKPYWELILIFLLKYRCKIQEKSVCLKLRNKQIYIHGKYCQILQDVLQHRQKILTTLLATLGSKVKQP